MPREPRICIIRLCGGSKVSGGTGGAEPILIGISRYPACQQGRGSRPPERQLVQAIDLEIFRWLGDQRRRRSIQEDFGSTIFWRVWLCRQGGYADICRGAYGDAQQEAGQSGLFAWPVRTIPNKLFKHIGGEAGQQVIAVAGEKPPTLSISPAAASCVVAAMLSVTRRRTADVSLSACAAISSATGVEERQARSPSAARGNQIFVGERKPQQVGQRKGLRQRAR